MYYADSKSPQIHIEPNRCFYSEGLGGPEDGFNTIPVPLAEPRILIHAMYTKQVLFDKYVPALPELQQVRRHARLQPAIRWKRFSTRMAISFPVQTIKPKVQLQLVAGPGEIPREVEIERRLRLFSSLNLQELFEQANISMWELIPAHVMRNLLTPEELSDHYSTDCSSFPLEWFDDYEFDTMRPEDWLNLGILKGQRHPIPGVAFLPDRHHSDESTATDVHNHHALKDKYGSNMFARRNYLFKWVHVAVHDYDPVRMRWTVINMDTTRTYKIPRLFLMFLAESPQTYVQRVQHALKSRKNADRFLRFNLVQNNLRLTGVPAPGERLLRRIFALIVPALAFQCAKTNSTTSMIEQLEWEINTNFQWTQAGIELETIIRLSPKELNFIELPEKEVKEPKERFSDPDSQMENYADAANWLRVHTIFCLSEVVLAMDHVVVQCAHVSRMLFYTHSISKTASLEDFNAVQEYATATTLTYIKGYWVENLSGLICMTIRSIGKGWFCIAEGKWNIYLYAKMSRFLQLVIFHMQNALRNLITHSMQMFSNLLCKPCVCMLGLDDQFVWGSDVITSQFQPGTLHVFYLVLHITEERGPHYSNEPDQYKPMLLNLFNTPIYESHFVHIIDPLVMARLTYAKDIYLSSVGLQDPIIVRGREWLEKCYDAAVIPLKAYLREYVRHVEFFLVDVKVYMAEYKQANHTPQEFQDEISMHLRMKANLEVTLPQSIQIGPFLINVDPLKYYLVTKRAELASKLLDLLTEKLRDETLAILEDYRDIIKRLSERPLSIEQIFENREWMENLPDIITALENTMKMKMFEYDILDYFYRTLPNEDFKIKWDALASPQQCYKQIHATKEMYEEETARFQKIQTSDLAGYDEKVEALNMSVVQITSQYDTAKGTEIAVEIRKLWKLIVETKAMGDTLNMRQVLFEQPPINLSGIENLLESFSPYRKLWLTGADFLKWEEAWRGNPLPNVAPDAIRVSVDEYKTATLECIDTFNELPKVQDVAKYFLACIEIFEPKLDVLGWVKNPAWIMLHWQQLCKTTGLEIKYSICINFDYLLEKGIMKHYDIVQEISDSATRNRAALEAELEAEERAKREAEEELLRRKNARRGKKLK